MEAPGGEPRSERALRYRSLAPPANSTLQNELFRGDQALSDLKRCSGAEVVLVRCENEEHEALLVNRLLKMARKRAFVTAEISLVDNSFEALDEVVRNLVDNLVPPTRSGTSEYRGLLPLLDFYVRRHRGKSRSQLEESAAQYGAEGDLVALALAYVGAEEGSKRERREFDAWLSGVEIARKRRAPIANSALSPKTARKALTDLTRLLRALGFAGCHFCFTGGEALAKRTPRQREKGYTVIRELIDNFDNGRGAVATRIIICGEAELFNGERSLRSLEPLLSRLEVPSNAQPAPPHRSWISFEPSKRSATGLEPSPIARSKQRAARALVRISQGLPPTEAITSMSVGYRKIDATINQLLEHTAMSGSVFTVLTGDYGTGKTHLLLHLTERALEQSHPVFRLNLERLNFDLGNPQRHLHRLLNQSVLPLRHRPSALDRLGFWLRSTQKSQQLMSTLNALAEEDSEASAAAQRCLRAYDSARDPERALLSFLSGTDLEKKLGLANYRQDAYGRFLLWLELLGRLEDCAGPVLLIDEAENLYTAGVSRSERRTALRSLSFYCGGALPGACVILAITPKVLNDLKQESLELLEDITEQRTVLTWEDAGMLRRRLARLKPQPVPEFTHADRSKLAEKVRETHALVRGDVDLPNWRALVRNYTNADVPPRVLVRGLVDRLEHAWWKERVAL